MRTAILLLLLLPAACTRSFLEDEDAVEIHRDLVYAVVDDHPLLLDLFVPKRRTGPVPVVVWMHGGSWFFGTHHDCRLDWLAEEGYAVASIGYRKSLEAKWPAQLYDTRAAVRWLRARGAAYDLKTDRIAAAGMSAGGHLALMLGLCKDDDNGGVGEYFDRSSAVDAVISYYGPTDLAWYGSISASNWAVQPIPLLLGVAPRDDPERAKAASPIYQIDADGPPVLLIQGEDDFIVPPSQSKRFHERYLEAHLSSQLVMVSDAGHYGGSQYFGRRGPRGPVLHFLRTHLGE